MGVQQLFQRRVQCCFFVVSKIRSFITPHMQHERDKVIGVGYI